jgi:hypothetical protein
MPVQTINYANAPMRNGAQDILSGFNAAFGPVAASRKAEADKLAAELMGLQIRNEPTKQEYERALKEAQTRQIMQKVNLFSQFLGGGNPSGMPMGGNEQGMGGQAQGGQFKLDPSLIYEMFRAELGLGSESPQQQMDRAIATNSANLINQKNIEQMFPTAQVLTKNQEKIQGIEGMLPLIKEIIEMDVPSQAHVPLPGFLGENAKISNQPVLSQIWNLGSAGPNEQARYESLVSLAKDLGLKSQGLESNIPNLKTIEKAIARRAGESEAAYKDRMRDFYNKNIHELEHATGKKSKFQPYTIEKKGKGSEKNPANGDYVVIGGKNYKAADILTTMKDMNMTYDQVAKALEAKNGR